MRGNGVWTDLVDEFLLYTDNFESPDIYKLWCAISMVSSACERRVWTHIGPYVTYPNLYVLLVGTPGVGKSIIDQVSDLLTETKEPGGGEAFSLAANNPSRASLVDELSKAEKVRITKDGTYIYHCLIINAEEFEVLLPNYQSDFISLLNAGWNNVKQHRETRRHGPAKEVSISNPTMSIIGGVQPAWFVAHFPEEAWATGFIRRTIMVYAEDSGPRRNPFEVRPQRPAVKEHILQRLSHISSLQGPLRWEEDACNQISDWYMKGCPPEPTHTKLAYGYNKSRFQMLCKLAITATISRTGNLQEGITTADLSRALRWLLDVEVKMDDVFRSMQGRSDSAVMEELHSFVFAMWSKNGKEGVPEAKMNKFLMTRVTSEKIPRVIQVMEKADMIVKVPGTDRWLPRPKDLAQYH